MSIKGGSNEHKLKEKFIKTHTNKGSYEKEKKGGMTYGKGGNDLRKRGE